MRRSLLWRCMLAIVVCRGLAGLPVQAGITLTTFTNPHPVVSGGTIGFSFAGDKFVGSVQGNGTGQLYSTDLNGGNVKLFAPTLSLPGGNAGDEHFVASSLGLGGFPSRDIYVAGGGGGDIIHISHDGTSSNTFVSGLDGGVRAILFDPYGAFNHEMLVSTTSGHIYQVNSAGVPTLLASVGEDTEGMDIAPPGAGFGPFDGRLIVASEGSGLLRAVSNTGTVTVVNPGNPIAGAEELSFVPLNLGASGNPVEGFYGSDYTPDVVKAGADQFKGLQGDLVVTGEFTHLVNLVHFSGSGFAISQIGQFPNQPEDGIFVTSAILTPTPEPSTIVSAGLAAAIGLALAWRRRRSRVGCVGEAHRSHSPPVRR